MNRPKRCFVLGLGFLALAAAPLIGQIQVAGDLFVDLHASDYDPLTGVWAASANCGSCIGDFIAENDPLQTTSPQGVVAVEFNGASFFTADADTPSGLVGLDATRTIEVWAFNPSIAAEETLVSWGRRGGPEGSNMAFNYGSNQMYGAIGHWGGTTADKGWNNDDATSGAPGAGLWHHLAYTYDGDTTRVYADGELIGEEFLGAGIINTHATYENGDPALMRIATQMNADGTVEPNLKGTLSIGQIRVHDGVLDDVEIFTNFVLEQEQYPNPEPPAPPMARPLDAPPVHRYRFDEGPTADAIGREIVDSISGANGVVLGDLDGNGAGATANESSLSLNGGPSDIAAYVDLPNGLLSDLGNDVTVEGWFTLDGSQAWSRVFDFGSSQAGERFLPGGTGQGLDYLILSAQIGNDTNIHRFEINNRDEEGGSGPNALTDVTGVGLEEQYHFAAVYDGSDDGSPSVGSIYINGEKKGEFINGAQISDLNDNNNWLGRSNWTADANVQGTYEEFRLYDYALDQDEVLGNYEAGPDTLNLGVEGDVNADGRVDATDLNILGLNWQQNVEPGTNGDLNENGFVEAGDLNLVGLNWQAGVAQAASSVVPEPQNGLLLFVILVLLPTRYSRRS